MALTTALVCAWLVPASALAHVAASQETHESGAEMTVRLEADGTAMVQHSSRWRVVRGPLRYVDISNVDPAATVEPLVAIASDDGRALSGHAARRDADARSVRIALDDPHGAQRGTFTFDLRWRIDFFGSKGIAPDGSTWRLTLSEPSVTDGVDSSKTIIDLPSAPDAPRAIFPETGLVDDGALSTLSRGLDRDVLELVRTHVARGESVAWTVRVDARALSPRGTRPQGSASAPPPAAVRSDPLRAGAIAVLLVAAGLSFGVLLYRKALTISARCEAAHLSPRPFVPIPLAARGVGGGCALALSAGCGMADKIAAAGVFAAAAVLLAAWRAAPAPKVARGPGRWLALRPSDAFSLRSPPGDWLDAGTQRGRRVALGVIGAVGAVAMALRHVRPEAPWLFAMDVAWLVPLFVTGRVLPDAASARAAVARWLARAHASLRGSASIRVAPWARITQDGSIDELRLLVIPRTAMPGLVGIELGLACRRSPAATVGMPEILVRVLESSAASAGLAKWAPASRLLPGRRPDERVLLLVPATPTCRASTALVKEVAATLTDRRLAPPAARPPRAERRAVGAPRSGPDGTAAAGPGLC